MCTASVVQDALRPIHGVQESTAPDPVTDRAVDKQVPKEGEDKKGGELHALSGRTGDNCTAADAPVIIFIFCFASLDTCGQNRT